MNSPGFSSFRELMDKWDEAFKLLLENDLCLFFKKDGVIYGATENGRITFARMKNPESEDDRSWAKEASFIAYDISKVSEGQKAMSVFSLADIKKMNMISQEEAEKELKKKGKQLPSISDDEKEEPYGEE